MQGLRRQGRSYALQLLYQIDVARNAAPEAQERFWDTSRASKKAQAFGAELVETVMAHREEIDAQLTGVLEHWKLGRLPVIVRNALRLAVCEMVVIAREPHPVVINEALELIRNYMDEESARFANSVLEKVRLAAGGAGDAGDGSGDGGGGAADEGTAGDGDDRRGGEGGGEASSG